MNFGRGLNAHYDQVYNLTALFPDVKNIFGCLQLFLWLLPHHPGPRGKMTLEFSFSSSLNWSFAISQIWFSRLREKVEHVQMSMDDGRLTIDEKQIAIGQLSNSGNLKIKCNTTIPVLKGIGLAPDRV